MNRRARLSGRINWLHSSSSCLAYTQARAEAPAASFAAHMLHRERVQPLTDEEKAAGAKLISAWVMSAPRAAARAYCKAVDAITGAHKHYTPAELLFNVANISILAHIDLSTASLSISQLSRRQAGKAGRQGHQAEPERRTRTTWQCVRARTDLLRQAEWKGLSRKSEASQGGAHPKDPSRQGNSARRGRGFAAAAGPACAAAHMGASSG